MPKRRDFSRLDRLDRLQGFAGDGEAFTMRAAAEALGVSVRTVARDLELLGKRGNVFDGERGRGGGMRLAIGQRVGRIQLDAQESIDLLLATVIAEKMDSPLLLGRLRGIRQKLANVFTRADQEKIKMLRRRILVGSHVSAQVLAGYRPHACRHVSEIGRAFLEMRPLAIAYRDQRGRVTQREVEPHYLYLSMPAWYLLCWDRLREDVRTFRIDRIEGAGIGEGRFRLRGPEAFLRVTERSAAAL